MHGTLTKRPRSQVQKITVTPEMATKLLEGNGRNRPLSDGHMKRLANQIRAGKWRFNGDAIKIASTGDVLDGQHRLWAVIEANTPIETLIVYDIEPEAFATIDTLRKPRSGGDVIALAGQARYRTAIAGALAWLIRWQRGIEAFRDPKNRVENSDIEEAFRAHPAIVQAIDRAMRVRSVVNPSIIGFLYYVTANRKSDLAERMMDTLEDPAGIGVNDPFFKFRSWCLGERVVRKAPLMTIALAVKAINAATKGERIQKLCWRNSGRSPEPFPKLEA